MFVKKDDEFECINCKNKVSKLEYTSRDHCPKCLHSLHVDITPGDRSNLCKGILVPVCIEYNKGKEQIVYKCNKCKETIKNIVATDDDRQAIYDLALKFAKNGGK